MDQNINDQIKQTKALRVGLDKQLQLVKSCPSSREKALSITKIQEAIMWLGMDLKRLGDITPYKEGYNPNNAVVEPTGDGLKM